MYAEQVQKQLYIQYCSGNPVAGVQGRDGQRSYTINQKEVTVNNALALIEIMREYQAWNE